MRVSEVLVNTLTGTVLNYYGAIFMLRRYFSQEGSTLTTQHHTWGRSAGQLRKVTGVEP